MQTNLKHPHFSPPVCSVWDKGYRFGFNGKEIDKGSEGMGGGGSTYDYGFRIYNPSLGKFLSVDPLAKEYPWNSSYAYAENTPIAFIDLEGLERYYAADGVFLGKLGEADYVRVVDANNVENFKGCYQQALMGDNGANDAIFYRLSYSLNDANNDVFSDITTNIFNSTVKDGNQKLYNNKISVEGNNVPSDYNESSKNDPTEVANSKFYNTTIGGVINFTEKMDQYFDLINVMYHEQQHNILTSQNKSTWDNYTHFDIYMKQMGHWSWNKTSLTFKNEMRNNATDLLSKMSMYLNTIDSKSKEYKYYKQKLDDNIIEYESKFNIKLKVVNTGDGYNLYSDPSTKAETTKD